MGTRRILRIEPNSRFAAFFSLALVGLSVIGLPCAANEDLRLPRVIVASGGPYECRNNAIEKFNDAISIPMEYLRHPLSLVCTNGSETSPGFEWVRMFMLPDNSDQDLQDMAQPAGRLLIDESSFVATSQVYLDMTGQVKPGRNNLLIEGAGRPGAVYSWEIRSIGKPILFMPQNLTVIAGSSLTISGGGFSIRPDENIVFIGLSQLPVSQATPSSLTVLIPKQFPAGTYRLAVAIRSYRSQSINVNVKAPGR